MSEKKKCGRPRKHVYINIADFLLKLEEHKKQYLMEKKIATVLLQAAHKQLEQIDLGNHTANGYKPNLKTKFHGSCFKCTICGEESTGTDFMIDMNHNPPRIRYMLDCGHRQELIIYTQKPRSCPKCGGEVQKDQEGCLFCVLCDWVEPQDFGEL